MILRARSSSTQLSVSPQALGVLAHSGEVCARTSRHTRILFVLQIYSLHYQLLISTGIHSTAAMAQRSTPNGRMEHQQSGSDSADNTSQTTPTSLHTTSIGDSM